MWTFSLYKSLTSLINFIPRYFTLISIIVNGIIFIILFLSCSLLEHRNATHFMCWFISCKFVEFAHLFYQCVEVWRWFSGFSTCKVLSHEAEIMIFPPSQQDCVLLLFFVLPYLWTRAFNTMLNGCSEISHLCIISDLQRKSHSISQSVWNISCGYYKYRIFLIGRILASIPTYLTIVGSSFEIFLNLVYKCLIEDFASLFIQEVGL